MWTNWKSTLAFFLFIGSHMYAIYKGMSSDVLYVTGYIAFWSSVMMMLRNELTPKLIQQLIEAIGGQKND